MSITITNTSAPSETPIISAKDIQIECPKTAEQKDTEIYDQQQTSFPTDKLQNQKSIEEKEDEEDGDYNPEEEQEIESEDVSSDEESETECKYSQSSEQEMDEEDIVNSREYEQEFAAAIENIRELARKDGEKILEKVTQDYFDETGIEATEQEIADALDTCAIGQNQEETEEEQILNSVEFQEEFAEAIEHIEYIAKIDGERIIAKIEQDYFDECEDDITDASYESDEEESVYESVSEAEEQEYEMEEEWEVEYEVELDQAEFAEALDIVREIAKYDQEQFVDELCDTFVEMNGCEPTVEQLENVFGRIKATFADEAREEFLEENDAESDSDSDYEVNEKAFNTIEKDNKYDNNLKTQIVFVDNDTETESESDSEYEEESEIESENYSEEESDDDDEADSDYSPEKDSFDYTQDDQDEEQFEVELKGTDENEVECETADIE